MKCPHCGAAELVHDTRQLPYIYGTDETAIPSVTADFCPTCDEAVLDAAESARVSSYMLELHNQVNARFPKEQHRIDADIREFSFEEFVAFLFDREAPSGDQAFSALVERRETPKWTPWYWRTDVIFDPERLCSHYLRLFHSPQSLLDRFSHEQLEQGFWAIQTSNLDCSADHLIWDEGLPFTTRAECVRAMFDLFRNLFASEGLETSVGMWWDSFCYDWHCGNRKRSNGGEDLQMQDVMFETLVKILSLDSKICQGAALHGLSHLHHPETDTAIQSYLDRNPDLDAEWRNIALGASRFELM